MKESDITPKVIKLAKEIAEYWRMEIYGGCWLTKDSKSALKALALVTGIDKWRAYFYEFNWGNTSNRKDKMSDWFPIPSISDCLEKLRKLDIESFGEIYQNKETTLHPLWDYVKGSCSIQRLHQALLSALLEVLRGESFLPSANGYGR